MGTFTPRNSATGAFTCAPGTASISPTPATLSGFTYVAGNGPSTSQSFNLGGSNLTAGTAVSITAPTDYEVSLAAGSGYGASLSLLNTAGGTLNTTIYVRLLTGLSAATYNENVAITGGGTAGTTNVAVNGTVTPAPALTAIPASLTGFSTSQGAPSAAQTYLLSGTNLSSSVTVTAPAGYEVAQGTPTTPGPYAATQTVTQANATAGRTVYVRLTAAAVAGPYGTPGTPVNVTNAATNAVTLNVPVDGTVTAPAPVLTATGTLTAFNALAGQASAAQTYTLTGSNLTSTVSIVAPAGYELSAVYADASTSGGYFTSLTGITAAQVAGAGATISVRLAAGLPTDPGSTPGGNVANSGGGTGSPQNVAVTGTIVGEPATIPAPAVAAGITTPATVPLTLTAGAGTRLLVVVRPAASAATAPVDGVTYTASTTYGVGTALGAGRVVFAAANAASVTVTGLTPSTGYVADVYTYNVGTAAGFENYEPTGASSGTFTTQAPPPTLAGSLFLEDNFDYAPATDLTTQGWTVAGTNASPTIATGSGNRLSDSYPKGAALNAVPATVSSFASLGVSGQDLLKIGVRPTSTAIYGAAVINVSAAQTGAYFMGLSTGNSTSYRSRVFIKSSGSGYVFGLASGNETETYDPQARVFSFNINYVLVMKMENSAATGNVDVASLFVLPANTDISQEPFTPLISVSSTATTAGLLNSVLLRQATSTTSPTLTVDGLRLATGWGAVVGRPAYTAAAATISAGNYYDVTVNNADVLASAGAVYVEGRLNLTSGKVNTSAANPLTLYAAATTAGGSATSFVNGPLARVTTGPATTVFPVGKGTAYRPLTLAATAQASTTTYTGEVLNTSARTSGVDAPLDRVSNIRYATLTPDVQPTGFSGTLTLAFGTDDYVTDPQDNTLVVAKRNGTANWVSIGRTSANGTATGGNVAGDLTSDVFTSFSDFALASTAPAVNNALTGNPLPVQLTAFSAQRQVDQGVALKWNTASEKNSAQFEVQRSATGRDFSPIGTVAALGSSNQAANYSLVDRDAPAGLLYYRLRQLDRDGSYTFSPVVVVGGDGRAAKVLLYPNPAQRYISFIAETATSYRVLNQLGQPLLHGTTTTGTASIGLEALPAGLYFLELQTAAGRTAQKFEKE